VTEVTSRTTSTFRICPTVHGRTNYHGGIAVDVADHHFTCRIHAPLCTYTESASLSFPSGGPSSTLSSHTDLVQRHSDTFFTELRTYLELLALYKCQIVVAGDFNIYAERSHDSATVWLPDLLFSIGCVQNIPLKPTNISHKWMYD